jgi:hypothetical protein
MTSESSIVYLSFVQFACFSFDLRAFPSCLSPSECREYLDRRLSYEWQLSYERYVSPNVAISDEFLILCEVESGPLT